MMLLKIAWRNVWRSRLRSSVVIFAIIIGIWAGIFMSAMSIGISETRTRDMIQNFIAHGQIHNPNYTADKKVAFHIEDMDAVESLLTSRPEVVAHSRRTIFNEGMLASAKGNRGVKIIGVDPEMENKVFGLHNKTIDGSYFETYKGRPVFIGKKLAEKYDYEIGKKCILQFQDAEGTIHAVKFKVCGIFESINLRHDESTVYVMNKDLIDELGHPIYHEIAYRTEDKNSAMPVTGMLQEALPNQKVQYWGDISPELSYSDEMMTMALYIYMGIIMLALLFGIINTMLMAVLERKRELGMLMSVGMTKTKVFGMVLLETIVLALVGGPIGMLAGHITVMYFGRKGINVAALGEGMNALGFDSIIYTQLPASSYIDIAVMVIITALLAALYPARKALKLNPAEAVRAI
ncbi:MAG: ABC transporter permease [Bacteroidetes bacterium]|nr:ABC transporter permease [Bacteroidota bacterium]